MALSFFLLCAIVLIRSGASALDAGAFPFDLGSFPFEEFGLGSSEQRGLDEISELPRRQDVCPVCGFLVDVPLVDSLMRVSSGENGSKSWRMDAAFRDSDFCPYPAPNKVFWQADVIICPNCGYAAEAIRFSESVSKEASDWVLANLQPELREAQAELLGWRRGEMTDKEVAVFFNRQSEIPDAIRLEHWLTCLDGMHASRLKRARGCWESAWGFRRRLVDKPKSEIFVRHEIELHTELSRAKRVDGGLRGEVEAVREVLKRKRQKRERGQLPGGFDMTGRLYLAGLLDRRGFLDEAEKVLLELYSECRERFLRPEQDPLWVETSTRASRTHRLNELELMRSDAEKEVFMHLELVRGERSRLQAAAELIRQHIAEGGLNEGPGVALLSGYLVGEFLRRTGNLPLATEWFTSVVNLGGIGEDLRGLIGEQLALIEEEAGGKVNLLSALGRDGGLLARLREIWNKGSEAGKVH